MSFLTTLNCSFVDSSTVSGHCSGSMGSDSARHAFQSGLISCGCANPTRCPIAHVTTYSLPCNQPAARVRAPTTCAISRATDGFSATTTTVTVLFQVVSRKPTDRKSVFRGVEGIKRRGVVLDTVAEDAGVASRITHCGDGKSVFARISLKCEQRCEGRFASKYVPQTERSQNRRVPGIPTAFS